MLLRDDVPCTEARPIPLSNQEDVMSTATRPKTRKVKPPQVKDQPLFIGGKFVDGASGKTFPAINPATGETICQVAEADKSDVDRAVQAARKALEQGPWKTMDAADRGRLMFKLADLVEQNAEELAALESLNSGKIITDARGDMQGVVNTLRYYAGWADKIEGRTVPVRGNFLSYTLRQPVGVVGQIIPWNFPLLMLAWKWGPALACGNTVVMKLAEQTPITGIRVAELALEAGFPDGVINVLNGYGETTGAAMVAHPGVDKIAFTGHFETAKIIQKSRGRHAEARHLRAGRQEPQRHLRRCRPRRGRAGRLSRDLLPRRPMLHRRQPAVRRGRNPAGVRRSAWPSEPSSASSAIRSTRPREQGPQVSQEQMDKILGYVELGAEARRQARDRRQAAGR